jgi:hypothetical protein
MDFSNLVIIDFHDLIPGNKYYIQKMEDWGLHHPSGTSQKYGIFSRIHENIFAVFSETYNFKNPYTNEYLRSGMGVGIFDSYCHRSHFIFYEPKMATYNRKQNELLGKVMGNITGDTYMDFCVGSQGWLGIAES